MSLKGNLSSVNLTEIFQMLSLSAREGTLFIYEGSRKRSICFTKEGVSIRSRERNESNLLGKILVRLGKIDEPGLQQAVEERRSREALLGDVLVEMELCAREDVDLAFRMQSEEDIHELFLNRSDAQFEYVDGYFPDSDIPYVDLNVNSLLIDIARRTDEWEYIRRRIRGPREIYRFGGQEGSVEADVLAECYSHRIDPFIDGTHSVGEMIDLSYVNKFEVCKLLATYLDAEVIELVPPDAIRQNARLALRMGDPESAIRHYEYLMSTGDFPLDVMGEAAEAHEATRDFAEAAALLRRLAEELVRAGDYRGAIDALRRVANYPRPEPEALRFLLELVFENPRAAAEFAANIVEAGKTLVAHHIKHEQSPEALELLERLIEIFPDEVAFPASLVTIYYEEGHIEKAAQECERLANTFMKRRKPSPAISLYKKLLIIDPERQDIREKIRKIVSGRNKRRNASALPRLAIALAVSLLLGGAAVVLLQQEGNTVINPGGVNEGALKHLVGQALEEQGNAEVHGGEAAELFDKLLRDLDDEPLQSRERIVANLRAAEKRFALFEESSGKAQQIAETIRRQTPNEETAQRARAMVASAKDLEDHVLKARQRWINVSQTSAEKLAADGIALYKQGRLERALEHFTLARELISHDNNLDLGRFINNIRNDVKRVKRRLQSALKAEQAGAWVQARRTYLELLGEFSDADLVREIRLPVEIQSVPPGADIWLNGSPTEKKTPSFVRVSPFDKTDVILKKKSFVEVKRTLGPFGGGTDAAKYAYTWPLLKAPTWVRTIKDPIVSQPIAWRGRVAYVGRNGRWYVRSSRSGKQIASDKLKSFNGVAAGLATDGKFFFIPSLDGKVFAFDAATCKLRYTITMSKGGIYAAPVVHEGKLYIVDYEGSVAAYDLKTHKRDWRQRTPNGVRATPVVQGEDLVIVNTAGQVTVIHRPTGNKVIDYRLRGTFNHAPAVFGRDDLIFPTEEGMLLGVGRITGTVQWSRDVKSPITATPPVRGRAAFVAPKPGELVAIDTKTGDIIYSYSRSHSATPKAVAQRERIFFANGRTLSAYARGASGYGLAWSFQAKGRILAGPIVRDGAVYIGDEKGNFYRLEAND